MGATGLASTSVGEDRENGSSLLGPPWPSENLNFLGLFAELLIDMCVCDHSPTLPLPSEK